MLEESESLKIFSELYHKRKIAQKNSKENKIESKNKPYSPKYLQADKLLVNTTHFLKI